MASGINIFQGICYLKQVEVLLSNRLILISNCISQTEVSEWFGRVNYLKPILPER